jgi:hypothetical protein
MPEPVLVVHGVNTRDLAGFEKQVQTLSLEIGSAWNLIPVFWGDLGADPTGLSDTIPPRGGEVRSQDDFEEGLGVEFLGATETPLTRSTSGGVDQVVAALEETAPAISERAEVENAVRDQWDRTGRLKSVNDPEVLEAVGRAVGRALAEREEQITGGPLTRSIAGDVSAFAAGVLHGIDQGLGMVGGTLFGRLNAAVRDTFAPQLGRFLGDVFVYQRHSAAIHARVHQAIAEYAPGQGTKASPISVVAHSLGGLVCFDLAVAGAPPVWIKNFVTFGSQSAFFHVLDPRGGGLARYRVGVPVVLPETIARWVSLWEPLDPLAFLAGRVFRLARGDAPVDVRQPHLASSTLWTHSSYWTHPRFLDELKRALAG